MDNESGTQIRSIAVEYPGEKTEIVATKDWATVSLSLGISELASGETMTLRMASEKYSYSMTPFEIGDALQVIPNDDGTCLLYTSDAADEGLGVDLGGRRIIKKIFFKQKTAYEISLGLVGSEMCIRDRCNG